MWISYILFYILGMLLEKPNNDEKRREHLGTCRYSSIQIYIDILITYLEYTAKFNFLD